MWLLLPLAWLPAAPALTCRDYAPPERVAAPLSLAVSESSGLIAARRRPGVLYTHNDSGSAPLLHSVSVLGEVLGAHPLPRGWINDWEGLGAGPCPAHLADGDCLYIGDIGDNRARRERLVVRVVAEPEPDVAAGSTLALLATWRLTYPGQKHDAEALLVHPRTGEVDLLTKALSGRVEIYRAPHGLGDEDEAPMRRIGAFDVPDEAADPLITGGDWGPDGELLVLRTYNSLLLWRVDPCAPDGWWDRPPDAIRAAPDERQGEAVAIGLDGHLYTTSEGRPMPLTRMRCLDPQPAPPCALEVEPEPHAHEREDRSFPVPPRPLRLREAIAALCGGLMAAVALLSLTRRG